MVEACDTGVCLPNSAEFGSLQSNAFSTMFLLQASSAKSVLVGPAAELHGPRGAEARDDDFQPPQLLLGGLENVSRASLALGR